MKLEIINVEKKSYEKVTVVHIYPPNDTRQEHIYRRHGPTKWTHFLGQRNQFLECMETDLLEDAYQEFKRRNRVAKPKVVN